jgi:WD40 repeat protein
MQGRSLMKALIAPLLFLLGALMAAGAGAQSVAVANDDSSIAVFSEHVERRLLRVHFDQAAGKVTFSPFGPPGVAKFAVAPKGAFVVYAGIPGSDFEQTPHLFLLDSTGKPMGKPVPSPIGEVSELAVSPKGDFVAASSDRGWISLFAVERAGKTLRLQPRATFGVSPGTYTFAFRPDGGLVTMTDDLVAVFRTPAGAIQRVLDLNAIKHEPASSGSRPAEIGSGLVPIGSGMPPIQGSGAFRLRWSPRGDRFALISGLGPVFVTFYDAAGHRLNSPTDIWGTEVEYVEGGDGAIVSGMNDPAVVRMTGLGSKPFGGPYSSWPRFVALSGGRRVITQYGDTVSLWSSDGKQIIAPTGFENYAFDGAEAGAENEAIVSAVRSGWVDLFTKQGEFVRRVQFGIFDAKGDVVMSADGTVVVAYDGASISTLIRPTAKTWRAAFTGEFVAIAANGSRIVAAGSDNALQAWSRDGGDATTYALEADGKTPERPVGLAVSPEGDIIVMVDEKAAAWFATPADRSVRRVALPAKARVVVALADGFAFGLADGSVVRLGRDSAPLGEPIKAWEFGGVKRIAVSDDGQSFLVVEDDLLSVRHLDWNGRALARPLRLSQSDRIMGAFFEFGRAMLILWREKSNDYAGDSLVLRPLVPSPPSGVTYFEQPR